MLTVKQRQKLLSALGYYKGAIDGIVGTKTKAAYKTLQKEYEIDVDGICGKDTETVLRNAYIVETHSKNFKLKEFRCGCGGAHCCGYPCLLDANLITNLQRIRDKVGIIQIKSGLRCAKHNAAVGGIATSRHMRGKAADIYNALNKTEQGRITIQHYWRALPNANYTYSNIKNSHPNMGYSVHVDVK